MEAIVFSCHPALSTEWLAGLQFRANYDVFEQGPFLSKAKTLLLFDSEKSLSWQAFSSGIFHSAFPNYIAHNEKHHTRNFHVLLNCTDEKFKQSQLFFDDLQAIDGNAEVLTKTTWMKTPKKIQEKKVRYWKVASELGNFLFSTYFHLLWPSLVQISSFSFLPQQSHANMHASSTHAYTHMHARVRARTHTHRHRHRHTHTHTHIHTCTHAYTHTHRRSHTRTHFFSEVFDSHRHFPSFPSSLLSVLALEPTVILRVYSCLDRGPETRRLQHV